MSAPLDDVYHLMMACWRAIYLPEIKSLTFCKKLMESQLAGSRSIRDFAKFSRIERSQRQTYLHRRSCEPSRDSTRSGGRLSHGPKKEQCTGPISMPEA